MKTNLKTRGIALVAGGAIAASALIAPGAQAATKKQYKTGALILGAIGVYYGVKGKTVPAVVAGAGAYYAYKKGKKADDRSADVYPDTNERYSRNGDTYPDDLGYDSLSSKSSTSKRASLD